MPTPKHVTLLVGLVLSGDYFGTWMTVIVAAMKTGVPAIAGMVGRSSTISASSCERRLASANSDDTQMSSGSVRLAPSIW
jgi:hypothetical protein